MNDKDLVNKLKTLQRFEPRDETMVSLKQQVLQRTGVGKNKKMFDFSALVGQLFAPRYQLAYAFILILIAGFLLRPVNPMNRATETVQIAVNSLQQARNPTQVLSEEKNLDKAHAQLASLNLNGEPGQYTREQCRQIYNSYEAYLQEYQQQIIVSGQSDARTRQLYDKITQYQQEIEKKWPAGK